MRRAVTLSYLSVAGLLAASTASAQISATALPGTLSRPIALVQPPGDSRLFVVEQRSGTTGRVRIIRNNALVTTPFLSVTGLSTGNEQGLLGFAFHPDFPTTPYVYASYTDASWTSRITRYTVSSSDPDVATTPYEIIRVTQPFTNHNGGSIHFGSDGMLYFGLGDGGSGNDPRNNAQNQQTLLGKFIRIDVNRDDFPVDPNANYGIPAGNAYTNPAQGRAEIYSSGWRNPWQWRFDNPRLGGFGGLIAFDVGQNNIEEISYDDLNSPGRNFGWRVLEGTSVTGLGGGTGPFTNPIFEYDHSFGCSISGGAIYRGTSLGPDYFGAAIYSDFCSNEVRSVALSINPETRQATALSTTTAQALENVTGGFASITEDNQGELYIGTTGSRIWKLTGSGRAATADLTFSATSVRPKWVSVRVQTPEKTWTWDVAPSFDNGDVRVPLPPVECTLSIKASHFLRRTVTVPAGTTAVVIPMTLINGDVDGNNFVNTDDYLILSDTFDKALGEEGFDARADLNDDDYINTDDYLILSDSFDQGGDA